MKKYIVCLVVFFDIAQFGLAQDNSSQAPFDGFKQAVSIVPQYAAISGLRIDYERKLKDGNRWVLFSPQIYLDNNGYDSYDKVKGFGLNIFYKKFLHLSERKNKNGLSRTTVYFATGPTYQHFSLSIIEQVPSEFIELGVTYFQFIESEIKTPINKFGANADFGIQFTFSNFILDFYGGVGLRYAIDKDGNMADFFNDDWTDFGYSGFLLDGGIRLGFFIP